MKVGLRPATVAGVMVAALLGLVPGTGHAQGLNKVIEGVFPTQLVPGQTTVINIAMNGGRNNKVTAVQISKSNGPTEFQEKYRELSDNARRIASTIDAAE